MSFFGFDTTLPRDRGRGQEARGTFERPDPFAGLGEPSGGGVNEPFDQGIDFEDTYDGLGDQLDDADDVLNDDTFGTDAGPATQVGKDYDFFGQTAQVSTAINEEHLRYSRQHPAPKNVTTAPTTNLPVTSKPVRTGYEKYREGGGLPDLKVDASLWGGIGGSRPSENAKPEKAEPAPAPSKKMMSLEEVEAMMRAQRKKPVTTQEQVPLSSVSVSVPASAPASTLAPALTSAPALPLAPLGPSAPPVASRPVAQPEPRQIQYPPPVDMGFQIPQRLPQLSPMQAQFPAGPPPAMYMQGGQSPVSIPQPPPGPVAAFQPRQILQNPNRQPALGHTAPPMSSMALEQQQPPLAMFGPSMSGPTPVRPHPGHGQRSMQMSEEERAALMMEDFKRAKRNFKIQLLSRGNGLMTPQDKNFITRIQLQQLVAATGNPNEQDPDTALAEDFYYQVHSHIRKDPRSNPQQPLNQLVQTYLFQTGTRAGGINGRRMQRGGDSHAVRMEQQVQRAVEAAKLKPKNKQLVIEGSLGKISFSNAKTPKPLVNLKRAESGMEGSGGRPQGPVRTGSERKSQSFMTNRGSRQTTLRQIEKVYTVLMRMEDHERHMPPKEAPQHGEWVEETQRLNQKLWGELKVMEPIIPNSNVPHPFIALLSPAKGKKMIPRIFRQIVEEQRVTILTMIVVHIGVLDVVRRAQLRPGERQLPNQVREEVELFLQAVMPSVFGYVNEAPLTIIIGLLEILLESADVLVVARAKVGLAILTMFLSRAELLKQAMDIDEEDWFQWTKLYSRLFDHLEPILGNIFPNAVNAGEDMYVWQFLAALGLGATAEQQQRLVMAVKDRVMETVMLSKTLPPEMANQRLGNVNLFMRAIGLDVELLE
ncbi:MAG: hypothetical protein M1823_002084 [Watsoniomyces obsoletus]|nr:MAG: hypothetical protein M1823_002084 [Watsoniomyces obsoletus]